MDQPHPKNDEDPPLGGVDEETIKECSKSMVEPIKGIINLEIGQCSVHVNMKGKREDLLRRRL